MSLPYYIPRMRIYEQRQTPPIRPAVKSLTGGQFWREAGGQDGRRVAIRRVRLDNDTLGDIDLLPGQVPTTAYVLMPNYDIRWYSVEPENFHQTVSDREKRERKNALGILALEQYKLQHKAQPTAEDTLRLATIQRQLAQLGSAGQGFFNTSYNCLGTKARGVYYGLSVGNIPLHLRFVNSIKPNRSISFRIKRLEAPKEQGTFEFSLIFGDDLQRYALVFGKDKEIEWRHYKPMPAADRDALEDKLNDALDAGRLTADDEKELYKIEAQHKLLTQGSAANDPATNLQVAALKKQEDKIRDAKKQVGDAAKKVIEIVEKLLYYDKAAVTVPEYIKTTLGFSIDVTIEWLRRGGALITIGNNPPFVWWDRTQKIGTTFVTMLRKRSKLEIKSTGGEFQLAMGAPNYATQASIYGAPFVVPASASAADFDYIAVSSPSGLAVAQDDGGGFWTTKDEAALPKTQVRAKVEIVSPSVVVPALGVTLPPVYQPRVDLFSGGDFAAEVYALDFLITPRVGDFGALVYDSFDHTDLSGVTHLKDVQLSAHEGNSLYAECTYRDGLVNGRRESGLPAVGLGKRSATISLIERETKAETTVVWRGRIETDEYTNLQSLHGTTGDTTPPIGRGATPPPLDPQPNAGSERKITVVGLEQVLNTKVEAQVAVDGQHVGDALRLQAKLGGLYPEEYAGIPQGEIQGLDPIPLPPAGESPRARPDDSATYLSFMRQIVADHAPGYELTTSDAGLKFSNLTERDRPDLNYSEDAPTDSTLRLLRPLTLRQNFDDFINRIVVIGAENPLTHLRVHIEEANPLSFDPRFQGKSLCYCGEIISDVVGPNDTLQTEAQAMLFARAQLEKRGRPPYVGDTVVPYRPDVKEGDKPYVKGRQYVVERLERGQLNSGGKGSDQRMTLFLRLAKDILLPA